MAGIKWEQGDGSRLETNENSCVANAHFGCEVARNYPRTYLPLRMKKKIPSVSSNRTLVRAGRNSR
jgi:hypothetical protein